MSASSDSLLPFTVGTETPVQTILSLHDAYLRAKSRRQAIEHWVAILGGLVIILDTAPLHPPMALRRFLLFVWVGVVVLFGALGASEILLRRRRERFLINLTQ